MMPCFSRLLGRGGIRLHRACILEMADFLLLVSRATVLVMDTTFLDGSWADALAMIGQAHPLVTALISADPLDLELISGAQERGAFDVLLRPIELERLRSSIWMAHEVTIERRRWRNVGQAGSLRGGWLPPLPAVNAAVGRLTIGRTYQAAPQQRRLLRFRPFC